MRSRPRTSAVISCVMASDAGVIVEVTPAQVTGKEDPTVVSGDVAAWAQLQDLLDTEWTPFHMHMR